MSDQENPNQGPCPVVRAIDCMPATTTSSSLLCLLTAWEGGLWPDQIRQGRNSLCKSAGAFLAGGLALACARSQSSTTSGDAKNGQSGAVLDRP
jgi:hypothetical protein